MCHNKTYNNKINRLHEKCVLLVYNDKPPSFEDLLEKENFVSIHHKNLQAPAIKMFKIHTKSYLKITQAVFWLRNKEVII